MAMQHVGVPVATGPAGPDLEDLERFNSIDLNDHPPVRQQSGRQSLQPSDAELHERPDGPRYVPIAGGILHVGTGIQGGHGDATGDPCNGYGGERSGSAEAAGGSLALRKRM